MILLSKYRGFLAYATFVTWKKYALAKTFDRWTLNTFYQILIRCPSFTGLRESIVKFKASVEYKMFGKNMQNILNSI